MEHNTERQQLSSEPVIPTADQLSRLYVEWSCILKGSQLHMNLLEPFILFRRVLLQVLSCTDCTVQHLLESASTPRKGEKLSQAAAALHEFKSLSAGKGITQNNLYLIVRATGTFAMLLVLLLGGFIVAKDDIVSWMKWGYYISPLMYGQNVIAVNEFLDERWNDVASYYTRQPVMPFQNGWNRTDGTACLYYKTSQPTNEANSEVNPEANQKANQEVNKGAGMGSNAANEGVFMASTKANEGGGQDNTTDGDAIPHEFFPGASQPITEGNDSQGGVFTGPPPNPEPSSCGVAPKP
ncbi:hypothetical protein POM88_039320 [Heracleum sosnowskyi]|uniref:ABC-2 type transporter transmembrane domain-containing protein n=1 Tax=Heracleum sosnowskyi TaxID=360622 RepID=A0AAD8HB02_9APIA|nr:hypothetical protein POM88_039320 [Heracleum sosnowskyi]